MPASVAVFKHTHNSNTVARAGMGAWRLAWKGEAAGPGLLDWAIISG